MKKMFLLFCLSVCFMETSRSLAQTVEEYRGKALNGDPVAQYCLAYCLYTGTGVQKDVAKSEVLVHKAMEDIDKLGDLYTIWCRGLLYQIETKKRASGKSDILTVNIPGKDISFNMVLVKAGSFMMGATSEELEVGFTYRDYDEEIPVHKVTLTKDYYIGETEVTQELYTAVMGANPSIFINEVELQDEPGCPSAFYPVDNVSYAEAVTFCKKLSQLTGKTFSLPTEAQWEYAARGGHKASKKRQAYAGSNDPDGGYVLDDNNNPVGLSIANELGLYEMSCNVFEYCLDYYGKYSANNQIDPTGPKSGQNRVQRGGCWSNGMAYDCHVALRFAVEGSSDGWGSGFRIVMIQ